MTSKERLLVTMRHGMADRVPVTPDMSNMIPARLTGKPFWDIYLYEDPPLWKAYIDAVKHFGFDGFLDGAVPVVFPDEEQIPDSEAIVRRDRDALVVRCYHEENGKINWLPGAAIYPRNDPPSYGLSLDKLGLPEVHDSWEPVENKKQWPKGEELFELAYRMMGDHGVVGLCCGHTCVVSSPETIFEYYDNPEATRERSRRVLEYYTRHFAHIMKMKRKPDFINLQGSGTLVFQTVEIFRDVSLPILKEITRISKEAGLISHLHSCGPEAALVQISAEETDLDVIDPLEIPPMGNCNLAELKLKYGKKLVLKGNLHTTEVMLRGSAKDVREASRQAIQDAGAGGGFILSTGDQCGRDTPDENIQAMIETVEKYGRY